MAVARLTRVVLVLVVAVAACLTLVSQAAAASLNIRDDAGVLTAADQQAIHDSANRAPFSVYVWTVKGGYTGNKPGFVAAADALVTRNQTVVIAVDTTEKFSHVAARNARVSSAATAAAKSIADSSFAHGQWGAGINAAIGSLSTAAAGRRGNAAQVAPAGAQGSFPWTGLIILLVIVGAIIAAVKALGRSRQRRGMVGPRNDVGPGYGSGGAGPAGYGGGVGYGGGAGYGPGYGGGGRGVGGMLAGGAVGGLGGGLLGYELGKEAGERRDGPDNGGYADQGQGGFVESDQGGGGADWGGGGGDDSGGDGYGGDDSGGGGGDSDF